MQEFNLEGHEYIELNKLLKLLRLVNSGGEANMIIESGEIKVNDVVEKRKRNKLKVGDIVAFEDQLIKIK